MLPNLFSGMDKLLSSNDSDTYDFSCAMLEIPKYVKNEIQLWAQNNINIDDIYYNENDSYGIEDNNHITIMYGYQIDDLEKIKKSFNKYKKTYAHVSLGQLNVFKKKSYKVLYIEVNSKDCENLRKFSLKSNILCNPTYQDYIPHVTIAYFKHNVNLKHYLYNTYFCDMQFNSSKIKITNTLGKSLNFNIF